jgi:hypothetical protein
MAGAFIRRGDPISMLAASAGERPVHSECWGIAA